MRFHFHAALIVSAFAAASKCGSFEFDEAFRLLKQKYHALLSENESETSVPCIVMAMDNRGVPSDFKSWRDYNATLVICTGDKHELSKKGRGFVSCDPVEENGQYYALEIPVPVSNKFIKKEQKTRRKFEKVTEYGDVPDFHSPWFVLREEQVERLFKLVDEYQINGNEESTAFSEGSSCLFCCLPRR